MAASVLNAAIVHGWCGYVEKANDVVFQQMVLNKLWIPDVLIDIIKDYLYVSATEVLRKYYMRHLIVSIGNMVSSRDLLVDVYGRQRIAHWTTGHLYEDGNIQMQGLVCMTCGDSSDRHQGVNGCCRLEWDEDGEVLELMLEESVMEISEETFAAINAESESVPDVGWAIDIPAQNFVYSDAQQAQFVLSALEQAKNDADLQQIEDSLNNNADDYYDYGRDDYDREAEAADYAEYQRECEMEAYEGRR